MCVCASQGLIKTCIKKYKEQFRCVNEEGDEDEDDKRGTPSSVSLFTVLLRFLLHCRSGALSHQSS